MHLAFNLYWIDGEWTFDGLERIRTGRSGDWSEDRLPPKADCSLGDLASRGSQLVLCQG